MACATSSAADYPSTRRARAAAALAAGALALGGCSSASDVGEQPTTAPVANVKALNHPFSESGGDIVLTVRSRSELRLTGRDSRGTTVPVLHYEWTALNAAAEAVPLVKRNESTVALRVPEVAGELEFRLTVIDGNGQSDDALVTVTVEEARDPDAFLTYSADGGLFTVVAVTDTAAALAADVPFELTIEPRASYTDLEGARHTDFPLARRTVRLAGRWLAANGTGGPDCADARNPRFALPLPPLAMDDVLEHVGPDAPQLAIDPATIDDAVLSLKLTLTPTGTLPAGVAAGLCVLDADGAVVGSLPARSAAQEAAWGFAAAADGVSSEVIVTRDEIAGAASRARDTRASAKAYYRTIDDADAYAAKATFSGWLARAGLSDGATDWEAMRASLAGSATGAHATYLNNFDLGFGRDMYARLGACDDGATPATLAEATPGACDVYSVVVNYGSLEGAARTLQPIVAVAMEYSRSPASGPRRIVKFYTYAPTRQGDFRRVLSIDLDGRGEKFMPASCTVCHSGTPRGLDAHDPTRYGNGGDVASAFLPWDLDSLLYSDTDPGFSREGDPSFTESERARVTRFTRAAQEAAFKRLNHLAYLTYGDERRFPLARELVEGWYGGAGLPSSTFDGSHVPQSWRSDTPGNPADAEATYRDVFARNCRSCHVMQVPGPLGSGQFAIGSYADFVGVATLSQMLESGRMPLARLTMDRFWLPAAGDERSAAQVLSEHLRDDGNDATAAFDRPGPVAVIGGLASADDTLVRGADYLLDARGSTLFPGSGYAWRLTAPAGSEAHLSFADSATPTLAGVDLKGAYSVSLSVAGTAAPSCAEAISDGSPATICETRERRDSIPLLATIGDQDPLLPVPLDAGITTPLAVGLRTDSPGDGARVIRSVEIADNAAGISAVACADALAVCVMVPAGAVADAPIPLAVLVEDADGDRAAAATGFSVRVPTVLTLRACRRDVPTRPSDGSAYPAVMIDISDCVVGAGTRGLRFLDAGGTEIPGGRFAYTPPAGRMTAFVTAPPDSTRRVLSDDVTRIDFRAEYANATAADADVSGTAEIGFVGHDDPVWSDAARPGDAVSFARLRAAVALGTTCGNCHGRPESPIGFLGATVAEGYARMRCGVDADDPLATPYVLLQDPTASALLQKPAGELNHSFRNLDLTSDAVVSGQVLPALRQWIEQGAYDTELGTQTLCP